MGRERQVPTAFSGLCSLLLLSLNVNLLHGRQREPGARSGPGPPPPPGASSPASQHGTSSPHSGGWERGPGFWVTPPTPPHRPTK